MRVYLFFLVFLCCGISSGKLLAQCPAGTPSATTTVVDADCPSNGQITVNASGGLAPYIFKITSGPITKPGQSSNVFSGMPPGTYDVVITDDCGTSTTVSVTIGDLYKHGIEKYWKICEEFIASA